MQDEDFDRACRLLNALVAAVQRHGVSSASTESLLARAARALQVRGEFLVTPTQVQSVLWAGDEDRQRLHISVASGGSYDMTKLSQITELVGKLESGEMTPDAGLDQLRAIDRASPQYGPAMDVVSFVLCGTGFGVILGISWLDVALAGALSVVSFGVVQLAAGSQGLTAALELVAAAIASALASLLALLFPGSNAMAVAVCACIYFVPGFGLTLGANELMGGHTLSGLIGFTRASVAAVKLVIGVLIGGAMVRQWAGVSLPDIGSGVPHGWTWVFAPLLVLGLSILFRVRRKDLWWPLLGGIVVWLAVQAGSGLGFWQGTFIGAFLLMSVSRLFARVSRLPSAIIVLPAVMLLVPGFSALQALYVGQTLGLVEGLRAASEVIVLIAAILGGVLLGEAVWTVRRVAASAVTSMRLPWKSGR